MTETQNSPHQPTFFNGGRNLGADLGSRCLLPLPLGLILRKTDKVREEDTGNVEGDLVQLLLPPPLLSLIIINLLMKTVDLLSKAL